MILAGSRSWVAHMLKKLTINLFSGIISAFGGVALTGERLPCTQDVGGSNPLTSTN